MSRLVSIFCGGWGESQLGDIIAATERGEVTTWQPASAVDQDKSDLIRDGVSQFPDALGFAFIGHSLGCDTVIEAAAKTAKTVLLGLVEPVWEGKKPPRGVECLWFKATFILDFPQADVAGTECITVPGTDHNSICHAADVVNRIASRLAEIQLSLSLGNK